MKPATLWARTLLSNIAPPGAITTGFEPWRTIWFAARSR
jgi:hypothetical protein